MTSRALTQQLLLHSSGEAYRHHFHHRGAIKPLCCCRFCHCNDLFGFLSVNLITFEKKNAIKFDSSVIMTALSQ